MTIEQLIKTWNAVTRQIELWGGLTLNGPLVTNGPTVGKVVTPAYGPNIAINAALGNTFVITITDGVAFNINSPTGGTAGQHIYLQFVNASGGAAGVGTFAAGFKMVTNTLPAIANGFNRTVEFVFNGTTWDQFTYAADVPN